MVGSFTSTVSEETQIKVKTHLAMQGKKNRAMDVLIEKLTNLQEARSLFYSNINTF